MADQADLSGDPAQQSDAGASSGEAQSGHEGAAGPRTDGTEAQLQAWLALGRQAMAVFEQLSTVLRLELGLALADARRLLLVLLAMVPLVLFAWFGLCVLLAWLAYAATASVALGLAVFPGLQLVSLLLLWRAARKFQKSLGLPASRRQWQALMQSAPVSAHTDQGRGQ